MKVRAISCPAPKEISEAERGLIASIDRQRDVRRHYDRCEKCKKKMRDFRDDSLF